MLHSVIIVSDSHGLTNELQEIKERHQQEVDAFIHCGDSQLDFDSSFMEGYERVRGNCDFDSNYPEDFDFSVDKMKFFVTHGHLYNVKYELSTLSYKAEEYEANIACFGHSHIAGIEKINNTLYINPGSIRMPRGGVGGRTPTYVRLTWNESKEIDIEFLDKTGQLVKAYKEEL